MTDWGWAWNRSSQPFRQGIIPVPAPQIPSLIPLPDEDTSATQVPVSAYAAPPAFQERNAPASPGNGTPSARGVSNALDAAGYFLESAAIFARNIARFGSGDKSALDALKGTTPYLTGPLAAGGALAGTISDIHQGTSPLDAVVGNLVRGGVVYGAGVAGGALTEPLGGVGSIPAIWAADRILPPAPKIGHFAVGILGPLSSFDPAYDPVAF